MSPNNNQTPSHPPKHYDVIIVGAGPAGTSCAMALANSNLRILMVDKESFPRDKICGDAVGGRSIKSLFKFAPELINEMREFESKERIFTTRVFINNKKPFNLYWNNEAYCIKRVHFDNLLFKHALNINKQLEFQAKLIINDVINDSSKLIIGNKESNTYFSANIVVAADGSQSFLAKKLIDLKPDFSNFSAAVRAYYSNVDGLQSNQSEVHIFKKNMPGYLWIFPVGNNTANVGFGMLSKEISKRKINLKQALTNIISENPAISTRFENAQMEGKIQGFGLALGSRKVQLYGDHFLLVGDAASLIDPKSGDGISHAIESGIIAANTIINAHKIGDFSKSYLENYKKDLNKKIGKELFNSTLVLRVITYMPFVINLLPGLMKSKLMLKLARRI